MSNHAVWCSFVNIQLLINNFRHLRGGHLKDNLAEELGLVNQFGIQNDFRFEFFVLEFEARLRLEIVYWFTIFI